MGSRGQCCATYSANRVVEKLEAERNVHLSALSLTVIAPFELPTFTGSQWFLLMCNIIRPTAGLWRKGQVLFLSVQPLFFLGLHAFMLFDMT